MCHSGQMDEEEFWRLYGQFKISHHYWQKPNKFLPYILIQHNSDLIKELNISQRASQCRQPHCQPNFVSNRLINDKSDQNICFSSSLDVFLTIEGNLKLKYLSMICFNVEIRMPTILWLQSCSKIFRWTLLQKYNSLCTTFICKIHYIFK